MFDYNKENEELVAESKKAMERINAQKDANKDLLTEMSENSAKV